LSSRVGCSTFSFSKSIVLDSEATVVGRKEGEGPLGAEFDVVKPNGIMGQASFERAEGLILREACQLCIGKAQLKMADIDLLMGGDLLNQLVSSNYCARDLSIPFLGLYGACSTFGEGLILAACLVDAGFCERVLVAVSSHHDSAERQFRYPVEFGGQRPPAAQWTVTAAGAVLCQVGQAGVCITHGTVGKVIDMGIKDANNLGAAMAPAAAEVIKTHFEDTGLTPKDYDMILTGDLGHVGHAVMKQMLASMGLDIEKQARDCGLLIYSKQQDAHAGGSGCGCSAGVFLAHTLKRLRKGELRRVLLVPTGALHSPCTVQQGESIPGIAHAVSVEAKN